MSNVDYKDLEEKIACTNITTERAKMLHLDYWRLSKALSEVVDTRPLDTNNSYVKVTPT